VVREIAGAWKGVTSSLDKCVHGRWTRAAAGDCLTGAAGDDGDLCAWETEPSRFRAGVGRRTDGSCFTELRFTDSFRSRLISQRPHICK